MCVNNSPRKVERLKVEKSQFVTEVDGTVSENEP